MSPLEPEVAPADNREMKAVRSACDGAVTERIVLSFVREPVAPHQKRVRVTYFIDVATCKVTRTTYELVPVLLPVN